MADEWVQSERLALTGERLARLKATIEDDSDVIMEHRFYRGASAPRRMVFDDFEELRRYIDEQCKPGDALLFWNFAKCCTDDNPIDMGKLPDAQGRTPQGGAY